VRYVGGVSDTTRPRSRLFAQVARLLGRVESRLVLSTAIIVSLLPFEWVPRLDAAFLLLFGIEFVLRALLVFRGEYLYSHGSTTGVTPTEAEVEENRGWQMPSAGTLFLMVFDLLALLSFVPSLLGMDSAETRWLRLFRLSRMLLLLSYWAPLVRDVWSVLLRNERAKQVTLMGVIVLGLSFAGAVVIDQMQVANVDVIDFDGDEIKGFDEHGEALDPDDEKFIVHLWWAFRQIQDPGNMLSSPTEIAAVIVSVALTIVGLFMVSFLIGLGTDVVRELMELSRLRPPGLHGHTIVVNIDPSTQQLLHELLRYSRKLVPEGSLSLGWLAQLVRNTQRGIRGARYLVVGRSPDPPDFLRQPELARVVYREVHVDDETFLVRTDVAEAQRVVLLADLEADDPDAETIQALLTITESLHEADAEADRRDSLFGLPGRRRRARQLIAEVLDESNVPAARAVINHGAHAIDADQRTRAFVVPSERLIALFMACIARRPGVGRLLEELLTSHGHELYTMFFNMPGLSYRRERRPKLPDDPSEVMAELIRRSRSLPSRARLVPVGVLLAGEGRDDILVHINPEPDYSNFGEVSLGRAALAGAGDSITDGDADAVVASGEPVGAGEISDGVSTVSESDLLGSEVEGPHEEVSVGRPMPSASALEQVIGADESRCIGFVAIADNFARVRELANDLYERPRAKVPADLTKSPKLGPFVCATTTPLERVLICGFRSGTVSMIESLIQTEPRTQILVMVADKRARESAWDDFDAHTKLVERGLLRGHHGRFEGERTHYALTWQNPDDPEAPTDRPHLHLVIGDWSSSRRLTSLPLGFGHVGTMDAVVMVSSEHHGSDARTAKTLMKLQTLTQAPRIVAEVLDVELARRLRRRSRAAGSDRVHVYSIQELRAFFMFQSVVVPAFDLVYTELMGPWGESFVRLVPDPAHGRLSGRCSFEELANHLSTEGRVLVGVELCTEAAAHEHGLDCPTALHIADSGHADKLDLGRLIDVWVISRDVEPL